MDRGQAGIFSSSAAWSTPTGSNTELFDVARQQRLLGFALSSPPTRDIAHQIADAICKQILGVPGAFWTRMAYVTASGLGHDMQFALVVADSDGANPSTVVRSSKPLLSPAWSPDGRKLAYVSFESGNSAIYVQDLSTGAREAVSAFRGINGAPSFSPDGRRLAMSLSKNGNPDIYVMDLGSRALTRITDQMGIDTEPTFSADGGTIYFTSDRGGRPQIYQVSANRRRRDPRHLPGQLQRQPDRVRGRQEDRGAAGRRQRLPRRHARPQPRLAAVDPALARPAGRGAEFRPERCDAVVRRARRRSSFPPTDAFASNWCTARANRHGARSARRMTRGPRRGPLT